VAGQAIVRSVASDRGQITGDVLDGPLAFDNAVDSKAAEIKRIRSSVAGWANVLVVRTSSRATCSPSRSSTWPKRSWRIADESARTLRVVVTVVLSFRHPEVTPTR
jgi:hypothetical protein